MRKLIVAAALAASTLSAGMAVLPQADASPATGRNAVCGDSGSSRNPEVVGLTADGRLICFRSDRPTRTRAIGNIRGLQSDTKLVGIDFRPANGTLYGLGDQGGVYTISNRNASVNLVGRMNVALRGTSFGTDFNPTVDRLRVVSDAGQNVAVNVDGGATTANTDLNYTAGTPTTGVTGVAYTNNDADMNTGTTLFDVDTALDQVAVQSPPATGSLVATGKLGVDTGLSTGVDIFSRVSRGSTVSNTAYAALSTGNRSTFYSVDLLTGKASNGNRFSSSDSIVGIAIPLRQG